MNKLNCDFIKQYHPYVLKYLIRAIEKIRVQENLNLRAIAEFNQLLICHNATARLNLLTRWISLYISDKRAYQCYLAIHQHISRNKLQHPIRTALK
ncbi:MAG: hypothetical protein WAW86_10635 [Gammaproteobacteria bacterium]